jgi:hypothetical protein
VIASAGAAVELAGALVAVLALDRALVLDDA